MNKHLTCPKDADSDQYLVNVKPSLGSGPKIPAGRDGYKEIKHKKRGKVKAFVQKIWEPGYQASQKNEEAMV